MRVNHPVHVFCGFGEGMWPCPLVSLEGWYFGNIDTLGSLFQAFRSFYNQSESCICIVIKVSVLDQKRWNMATGLSGVLMASLAFCFVLWFTAADTVSKETALIISALCEQYNDGKNLKFLGYGTFTIYTIFIRVSLPMRWGREEEAPRSDSGWRPFWL